MIAEGLKLKLNHLIQLGLNPENIPIVMGVSGGADSMAMAILFRDWWGRYINPKSMRAVVIDHGFRQESKAEAERVLECLNQLEIRAIIKRIEGTPPASGLQKWARQKRYEILCREALRDGAVLLTAHHGDDQTETIQFRLSRHSELYGLGGMQQVNLLNGAVVMRPFLNIPMVKLRQEVEYNKVDIVDDPSNRDPRFMRAKLREDKVLYEEIGFNYQNFKRLGQAARRISEHFDNALLTSGFLGFLPEGIAWIAHGTFIRQSTILQEYLIKRLIMVMKGKRYAPSADSISAFVSSIREKNQFKKTLGGLEWVVHRDKIWVYREAERPPLPLDIDEGLTLFDGCWLILAPKKMRVEALGSKRFAAWRRSTDYKFDAPARAYWRLPVLVNSDIKIDAEKNDFKKNTGLYTLEDGGVVPHISRASLYSFGYKDDLRRSGFFMYNLSPELMQNTKKRIERLYP